MKIPRVLALMTAAIGLLAFALPADAQSNRHGGGNSNGGRGHYNGGGHNNGGGHYNGGHNNSHYRYYGGGSRVNFYYGGGFGYPFFGYPFYGYPYYGYAPYGYGYGYPGGAYYTYDPRGIYQGRVVNDARGGNSVAVQVQQQLAAGGYYRGQIDGIIGDGTRNAIRKYERDNNLPVDGQIDPQLLATMGLG